MDTTTTVGYNPKTDQNVAIPPGVYPAHVTKIERKEFTNNGLKYVFELQFRIAEAAANIKAYVATPDKNSGKLVYKLDEENKRIMKDADFLIGRKIRSRGFWLQIDVQDGEGWKNNTYRDLCHSLGVEIPIEDGIEYLGALDAGDVVAKPCNIKVDVESYKKKGTDEVKYTMKVMDVTSWPNGEELPIEVLEGDKHDNEKAGNSDSDAVGF